MLFEGLGHPAALRNGGLDVDQAPFSPFPRVSVSFVSRALPNIPLNPLVLRVMGYEGWLL